MASADGPACLTSVPDPGPGASRPGRPESMCMFLAPRLKSRKSGQPFLPHFTTS